MSRKGIRNSNQNDIYVVYIGGFLVPRNRMPYDETLQIPSHMKVICVYPSGVSSLHDRVMQIFYELKGGLVHYGEDHSRFHHHDSTGVHFEQGKYPQWDENHPIHVIGHSFGGLTARVLQYYLLQGNKFHGYQTSSKWIVSVTTVNSPLNGALRTYSYGAHLFAPPLVRLASLGYWIGLTAHWFEYLDLDIVRSIYDFQLSYWSLSRKLPGSFRKLLLAVTGCAIHSTTDNSAYDMTVHSQLHWSHYLPIAHASTYHLSVVGTSYSQVRDWGTYLMYLIGDLFFRRVHGRVAAVDTSEWAEDGFDGLLTSRTQTVPFLNQFHKHKHNHKYEQFASTPNDPSSNLQRRSLHGVPYLQVVGDSIATDDASSVLSDQKTSRRRKSFTSDSTKSSQDVQAGIHYVKEFQMHHLDNPSEDRNQAWAFIFSAIQTFHTHHLEPHDSDETADEPTQSKDQKQNRSRSKSVSRRRKSQSGISSSETSDTESVYMSSIGIHKNNDFSSPPDRQIPVQLYMPVVPHSTLPLHPLYMLLIPLTASLTVAYLWPSLHRLILSTSGSSNGNMDSRPNPTQYLSNMYTNLLSLCQGSFGFSGSRSVSKDQVAQSGSVLMMVLHVAALGYTIWTLIRISKRAHRLKHQLTHHHEEPETSNKRPKKNEGDKANTFPSSTNEIVRDITYQLLAQLDFMEIITSYARIASLYYFLTRETAALIMIIHVVVVWIRELTSSVQYHEYRLHPFYCSLLGLFYATWTRELYLPQAVGCILSSMILIDFMTIFSHFMELIVSVISLYRHETGPNRYQRIIGNMAVGVPATSKSLSRETRSRKSFSNQPTSIFDPDVQSQPMKTSSKILSSSWVSFFTWVLLVLLFLLITLCGAGAVYSVVMLAYHGIAYCVSSDFQVSPKMIGGCAIVLLLGVTSLIQVWRKIRHSSECMQKLFIFDYYRP